MIIIYGMETCPDCFSIKEQIKGREEEFKYYDIGKDVRYMKHFIRIRDKEKVFDEPKANGSIGIPCFVKEDNTVTLVPEDVGLKSSNVACSIEDHRLGKKGC
jgi:glutaredoxin-related protein